MILLTLAAVLTATPQTPPPPPPHENREVRVMVMGGPEGGHGRMDKDEDGFVSRDEFSAPMADAFGRLDKDSDGRLSPEELADHGPGGDGEVIMLRDGAGGGPHVRRFEHRLPGGPGGPGAPGGEERTFIIRGGPDGEVGRPWVIHTPDGEHSGPGHRFEIRTDGMDGSGDMDKDGDGRVTEEEFTAPLRDAFRRMDADNSGVLEAGERGGENGVQVFTRRIETRDED